MKKTALFLIFILTCAFISAESGYYRRADFLLMNSSAQAAGLSGAVIARQAGTGVMTYNPAGLFGTKTFDISLSYSINGMNGLNGTYTMASMPTQYGAFGAAYMFNREDYNSAQVVNKMVLACYSFQPFDYFSAGINLKYAASSRLSESAGFLAADIGVIYSLDDALALGLTLANAGFEMTSAGIYSYYAKMAVPAEIKAGIDYKAVNDNMNSLTADALLGFGIFGSTIDISGGLEYVYLKQFFIRAGAATARLEDSASYDSYLSAGLGMNYELNGANFKLEYSYLPKIAGNGGFGESQVISISGSF